jgi:hypothetical protein
MSDTLDWEIGRYRWRQHRLLGPDIGRRRAVEEWTAIGFPAWRHGLWQETAWQTVPAATALRSPANRATGQRGECDKR